MMPDCFAFDLRPERGCTGGIASEIFTGISVAGESLPSRPFRYCVRHLNTWFALTPFARATSATDAPGLNVYSTIRLCSNDVAGRALMFAVVVGASSLQGFEPTGFDCPISAQFLPNCAQMG